MPRDRNLDRRLESLPAISAKPEKNPTVHALFKLHCFEWYVISGEQTPNGDWAFFGVVMPGFQFGYFSLSEIMAKRSPTGEPPELVVGFRRLQLLELTKKLLDLEMPEE